MKKAIFGFVLIIYIQLMGIEVMCEEKENPKLPLNYNGSDRKFCPASKFPNQQPPDRVDTTNRLRSLRSEMKRISTLQTSPLNGYIVTSDDEHQSETVHPRDERLKYISGFSGSAGECLVTENKAILWTDGRYFIQADSQLDCNWNLMKYPQTHTPTITEWLKHEFKDKTARIGADAKLVPAVVWTKWETELENTSISLIPVQNNLIDTIWQVNRPEYSTYMAFPLDLSFTGKPWQEKIRELRDKMLLRNVSALVVTAMDEIAWLFNLRGHDLPNTYVLRAYAVIEHGRIRLYTPENKLDRRTEIHLQMDECSNTDCVTWVEYSEIFKDLRTFTQIWEKVWLPSRCIFSMGASRLIYECIPKEKRFVYPSPVIDMRAEKNEVEIKGMRNAHLKDAVAMCDFLAYMEEQINRGADDWDELQVVRAVDYYRLEQKDSVGISFRTIAGYGPHAAIPHYEPTIRTNLNIGRDSTLVIDSGGQYKDGTTDLTRTLHFGEPTKEQREAYTRVLIGQIELSTIIFPSNVRTDQLDILARKALWSIGYDYTHGTSHGVGHYLSVHESPILLAYMGGNRYGLSPGCNSANLKPGYFLSNEPGYYKEGDFGVRLENVIEVVEADVTSQWGQKFLKFQEVALVPYEPRLIVIEMLSPMHRRWLNDYNKRIRNEVGAELKKQLRDKGYWWMMEKTQNIPEHESDQIYFKEISKSSLIQYSKNLILAALIVSYLCRNFGLLR